MPIRFRCAYCNQLMGIATRKAGSVIRCPKCAGEIIVPTPDDLPPPNGGVQNQVSATFEDQALDRLLQTPSAPAPTEQAGKLDEYVLPDRTFGAQALQGIFIARASLVLALVVVGVLLLLSFGVGFLAGYLVKG